MLNFAALLSLSTAAAKDILVIDGDPDHSDAVAVAAQLEDSEVYDFVVTVREPSEISSLTDLTPFDAVVLGDSGSRNASIYDSTFVGLLADYHGAGGGVLTSSWMAYVDGYSIADISPVAFHGSYCTWPYTHTVEAKHQITAGLSSFSDNTVYTETPSFLDKGAETLVSASCNGYATAVAHEGADGARQVYLGLLYFGTVSTYNTGGLRSGDPDTLLEQAVAWTAGCTDGDGDGFSDCRGDCDDSDAGSYPGGAELCDGLDNDCDGAVPGDELDDDADGVSVCEGDCDDGDASSLPGAAELCDGLDNDCDGALPDGEADLDADGVAACAGDCEDSDASISPEVEEVCDEIDNNCDGTADEGLTQTVYADEDGDGYGDDATAAEACDLVSGTVGVAGDCDDADASINPDASEVAGNGVDEDCDGADLGDDTGKSAPSSTCHQGPPRGRLALGLLAALGVLLARRR